MKNSRVNRLIHNYKLNKSEKNRQDLLAEISPFILHFPLHVYGSKNRDANMDFYLQILEQLDAIIDSFDTEVCSFVTYLSTVLTNRYLNFVTRQKRIKTTSFSEYFGDGSLEEMEPDLSTGDKEPVLGNDNGSQRSKYLAKFKEISDKLVYVLLKCYFFDFFEDDDIVILKEVSGKSYSRCLEFIDSVMESIQASRTRRQKLEGLMSRIHSKILEVQRQFFKFQEQYHSGEDVLNDIKEREHILRERQMDYLIRYRKIREFPAQDTLAAFFKIPRKQVANHINYFKKKLKNDGK